MLGDTREIGKRVGIRLDTANKLCQSVSNPADEIAEVFLYKVPGMVEAFGNDTKRSYLVPSTTEHGVSPPQSGTITFKQGETDMGDKGKKDKGKREQQKKAQLNPKEKRKLKREKKK